MSRRIIVRSRVYWNTGAMMESGEQKGGWLPFLLSVLVLGLGAIFLALRFFRSSEGTSYRPPGPEVGTTRPPPASGTTEAPAEAKPGSEPAPAAGTDSPSQQLPPEQDTQKLLAALKEKRSELQKCRKAIRDLEKELRSTTGSEPKKSLLERKKSLESRIPALEEEISLLRRELKQLGVDPGEEPPPAAVATPEEQRARYREIRKEIEDLKSRFMYRTAYQKVTEVYDELPAMQDRLDRHLARLDRLFSQAKQAFDRALGEAMKLYREGRYAEAMKKVSHAASFVPDLEDKVREAKEVQGMIRREALFKDMVRIPGGEVTLGSPDHPDEPVRTVRVRPFRIDSTEVTHEQYYLFVLATGAEPPSSWPGGMYDPKVAQYPVTGVNLEQARAFARWAGKRLPTEAEWERAARYVDGRRYPWGDAPKVGGKIPCHCLETAMDADGRLRVSPVGKYPNGRSPEGVFDLAGNVWEWTASTARVDGEELFVLKGGSFLTPIEACRGSNRLLEDAGIDSLDVGFRCVTDAE